MFDKEPNQLLAHLSKKLILIWPIIPGEYAPGGDWGAAGCQWCIDGDIQPKLFKAGEAKMTYYQISVWLEQLRSVMDRQQEKI